MSDGVPDDPDARAETLLKQREARGVLWAVRGHMLLLGVSLLAVYPTAVGIVDVAITLVVIVIGLLVCLYASRAARDPNRVTRAGLTIVLFDLIAIYALPFSWFYVLGGADEVPLAFFPKTDAAVIGVTLLSATCLSIRPIYPAIFGTGIVFQQIMFLTLALLDETTRLTTDPLADRMGAALHLPFVVFRIVEVAFIVAVLVTVTHIARSMIRENIRIESENRVMRERQAVEIQEGKMTALTSLVAGIAHEINTPLGVILASAEVQDRATRILRDDAPNRDKALASLAQIAGTTREASDRIRGLVDSLRDFAQLDEADEQMADVRDGIRAVVDLLPADHLKGVTLHLQLDPIPLTHCRPRALHQVFMTIISNACESIDHEGAVTVTTACPEDHIEIEISDSGRGMTTEQVDGLFELEFARKGHRVGMGLGLPAARRIVQQHDGRIDVKSELGTGTLFRIRLPIRSV